MTADTEKRLLRFLLNPVFLAVLGIGGLGFWFIFGVLPVTAHAKTPPALRLFINGEEITPDAQNQIHITIQTAPKDKEYQFVTSSAPGSAYIELHSSQAHRQHLDALRPELEHSRP